LWCLQHEDALQRRRRTRPTNPNGRGGCRIVDLGDDCQPAVAWSSRPVAKKEERRRVMLPLSCSAHEAKQAPCYKDPIQPYGRARLPAAIA
jgi:hypothetical protein